MQRRIIHISEGDISYLHREGNTPIVFLHGLGGTGNSWLRLVSNLDPDFEIFIPDLPGHGRSYKDLRDYTIEAQASAVREFLISAGVKDPVLVGNSYGGWISLRLSISMVSPQKLILVDSAGINPTVGEMESEFRDSFIDRLMSMSPLNNRRVLERIVLNNARKEEKITPEELSRITSPTAIIWGRNDKMIGIEYALKLHEYIPGSVLHIIDNSGHLPQIDAPEELGKILNSFVFGRNGL